MQGQLLPQGARDSGQSLAERDLGRGQEQGQRPEGVGEEDEASEKI